MASMAEGGPNRARSFSAAVYPGMLCQLYAHDSRGDGWQGAEWSGLGQDGLTLEDGFEKTFTFVVPHFPLELTGPCSLTDAGSCAASPNYPNSYGINEACTVTGVPAVGLEVFTFDVEADSSCRWDYLTVNGERYCGTSGPQGAMAEDGVIEWRSDRSGGWSGWKAPGLSRLPMLLVSDATPPPPPSDLLGDSAAFTAFAASVTSSSAFAAAAAAPPWRLLHHRTVLAHRRRLVRRVAKLPEQPRQERGVHHHWRAGGWAGGDRL